MTKDITLYDDAKNLNQKFITKIEKYWKNKIATQREYPHDLLRRINPSKI